MPHANRLTVHILAAVAEHERQMISERTRAALQAAKKRGKVLGNPDIGEVAKRGRAVAKANARRFAANVRPIIEEIMRAGATSHNQIAAKLNERNVRTGCRLPSRIGAPPVASWLAPNGDETPGSGSPRPQAGSSPTQGGARARARGRRAAQVRNGGGAAHSRVRAMESGKRAPLRKRRQNTAVRRKSAARSVVPKRAHRGHHHGLCW
jgi:hypothetical protein